MKIIPYQYAPYLNINNKSKYEKSEYLLVTTADKNNNLKNSKLSVNSKSDVNNTLLYVKSPSSVISNENVLSFVKEFKTNTFIKDKPSISENELVEQTPEPPKPAPNSRNLSKLESLSFISNDVFNSSSLSHQSSLDIVNYIINENDFKKAHEKEEKEKREKEEKEREEKEKKEKEKEEKEKEEKEKKGKEQVIEQVKEQVKETIPQILTQIEKITSPIKSAIEGFKTEIVASPLSAIARPLMMNSKNIRNDLQSNMNGTVFQNHHFNTYLESLNNMNNNDLINPYTQPLYSSYKSQIKDHRSQLKHKYDMERFSFDYVVKQYEEEEKKIKDMTPMTEAQIMEWLSHATPEEIYENMHKVIGIPKKMTIMSNKTTEVTSGSQNYPVLGLEQYIYHEPKAFPSLFAKYKNYEVSLYTKDGDLCCRSKSRISKLSIFPFPLHIIIGVSSCGSVLNIHVVIQNANKDYCIKTLSFNTASEMIAINYSNILYQNIYFDEHSLLRTTFVQIYIDSDDEELKTFVNRWFRVPFELANCNYEIITDVNQISVASQVYIFMTKKKDLYKSVENLNQWEDNMAIIHQTIYGHPLQVIMAALKERLYERWMLEYNEWKRYKSVV